MQLDFKTLECDDKVNNFEFFLDSLSLEELKDVLEFELQIIEEFEQVTTMFNKHFYATYNNLAFTGITIDSICSFLISLGRAGEKVIDIMNKSFKNRIFNVDYKLSENDLKKYSIGFWEKIFDKPNGFLEKSYNLLVCGNNLLTSYVCYFFPSFDSQKVTNDIVKKAFRFKRNLIINYDVLFQNGKLHAEDLSNELLKIVTAFNL